MMDKKVTIKSFAKVNLSIDVLGKLENGYHEVDMIMQTISLHDLVDVEWIPENKRDGSSNVSVELKTNRQSLPTDERNLAYKAAVLMAGRYPEDTASKKHRTGTVKINLKKMIPVAAGLAGGSGNAAAVVLALNHIWGLGKTLSELLSVGAELGADVPFCMMGQAKANKVLGSAMNDDTLACTCARASGTGTELEPLKGRLKANLVLAKPKISVSTPEVYKGMDEIEIKKRPDNDKLAELLEKGGSALSEDSRFTDNMVNVLELYTLSKYDVVTELKKEMQEMMPDVKVLMSGSGPTVFAVMSSQKEAQTSCLRLKRKFNEVFWAWTM